MKTEQPINRLNWGGRSSGKADRRELDKVERSIKEIVAPVEEGTGHPLPITTSNAVQVKA